MLTRGHCVGKVLMGRDTLSSFVRSCRSCAWIPETRNRCPLDRLPEPERTCYRSMRSDRCHDYGTASAWQVAAVYWCPLGLLSFEALVAEMRLNSIGSHYSASWLSSGNWTTCFMPQAGANCVWCARFEVRIQGSDVLQMWQGRTYRKGVPRKRFKREYYDYLGKC